MIARVLTQSPLIAASIYGAVVDRAARDGLAGARRHLRSQRARWRRPPDLLEQLQGRKAGTWRRWRHHTGSPFLEGPTVTVAGAALLQRVAGAVGNAGGTIQSSQVDVAGQQGGMVSCRSVARSRNASLAAVLYDLEAGMPFLFVDELTAEMPQAVGANDGIGRMHVQLASTGEWQGATR